MQPHSFDALTRGLGAATTRREALRVLGAFAATGALALVGVGCDSGDTASDTPRPGACATPSTCGARRYCSDDESCLCVETAEGDVRCGAIPTCDAPTCTTSADCTALGAGFFCDAPGSGCCGGDQQRCLAPCGFEAPAMTGTWTGVTTFSGQASRVRFDLADADGSLTGRVYVADPVTGAFIDLGEVSGTHSGVTATWSTPSGQLVRGTVSDGAFDGTIEFPTILDHPGFVAEVSLTRAGAGARAGGGRRY